VVSLFNCRSQQRHQVLQRGVTGTTLPQLPRSAAGCMTACCQRQHQQQAQSRGQHRLARRCAEQQSGLLQEQQQQQLSMGSAQSAVEQQGMSWRVDTQGQGKGMVC
jgi:hypothetical protein